jgi:hypothetical protein
MTILGDVPVRTRLPVSVWAFAALMTFFSLMSSLISAGETEQIYHASMAQLAGFFHAF